MSEANPSFAVWIDRHVGHTLERSGWMIRCATDGEEAPHPLGTSHERKMLGVLARQNHPDHGGRRFDPFCVICVLPYEGNRDMV